MFSKLSRRSLQLAVHTIRLFATDATGQRVCVIGSGPAGFYTAKYILKDLPASKIDIIEKLPTPFGLVRYGVAPDHPEVKNVIQDFTISVLDNPNVQFKGNIEVTWSGENGTPTISDLRAAYDAVIFAIGAGHHKSLKLPILTKEDLEARRSKHTEPVLPQEINTAHTCTAAEIVNWYNGHPGSILPQGLNNDLTDVIIIGNGNVALDVARLFLRSADDWDRTDVPSHVPQVLRTLQVKNVYVVGRRGPVQAAYTIPELREITTLAMRPVTLEKGGVRGCGLRILRRDLEDGLSGSSLEEMKERPLKRKTELLVDLTQKMEAMDKTLGEETHSTVSGLPSQGDAHHAQSSSAPVTKSGLDLPKIAQTDRLLHLCYFASPIGLLVADPQNGSTTPGVVFARSKLTGPPGKQKSINTDEWFVLPPPPSTSTTPCPSSKVSSSPRNVLVVFSLGSTASQGSGAPMDEKSGVIKNEQGRVSMPPSDDISRPELASVYTTGWARRGSVGIIGSNISDAKEVAATVVADLRTKIGGEGGGEGESKDESEDKTNNLEVSKNEPRLMPKEGEHLSQIKEEDAYIALWKRLDSRVVNTKEWKLIEAEERKRGQVKGKTAEKISDIHELLVTAWQDSPEKLKRLNDADGNKLY